MTMAPVKYQIGSGAAAVSFNGYEVPLGLIRQSPPAWRSGFEVGRDTRDNVLPYVIDDVSGGFLPTSGFVSPRDKNRVWFNQGLMVHLPKIITLPFVSTAQTTLSSTDISGFRAANKRVHAIMSSLGVSGQRYIAALGTKIYIDTSTSNPALTTSITATDNVLSVANLKLNATDYTAFSTDGTTNDTLGATDVTNLASNTPLVTHAHADDGFFAMDFFPSLGGGGWNVFLGVLNQVNGIYCYPASAVTLPLTSSTMLPVVHKATKDIEGSIATVTTSATTVSGGSYGGGTGDDRRPATSGAASSYGVAYWSAWGTPSNVSASDNAYATATSTFEANSSDANTVVAPGNILSDKLYFHPGDFSAIPLGADITGILFEFEAKEGNANDNIHVAYCRMVLDGSEAGLNMADGQELGTSDAYISVGGSTSRWGMTALKGSQVRKGLAFVLQLDSTEGASTTTAVTNTGTASIDHGRITLTYRMPGTQMSLPKGGWHPGKPPHRANRIAYIHPQTDEETTVNKPRIVTFVDFEHDPEGDRLVGSTSQPPIQMVSVDDATWYQGGLAVSGGSQPLTGQQVKLIDDDNVTRDLGFPAVHGTAAVRVARMDARGAVLMCYVANADSTDCQLWMYFNGKWNAYGALFSKTLAGAMSTLPIGGAEKTQGEYQNYSYCFYPSSTNTAVIRQFVPPDPMNADPFLTNTSIVKQDGPLYVQTVEQEILPSEANNAIMSLQMQSHRIDDNTSYGSASVKVNVLGDHTFAASAINETFDAAAEVFIDRKVNTGTRDPGVAFKTLIWRFTLDHQTGTTETPNPLPLVAFMVSDHKPLEKFEIHMITANGPVAQPEGPVAMAKRLLALMNTKVAQAFLGAGRDIPVKFRYDFVLNRGGLSVGELQWKDLSKAVISIEQTPGATT